MRTPTDICTWPTVPYVYMYIYIYIYYMYVYVYTDTQDIRIDIGRGATAVPEGGQRAPRAALWRSAGRARALISTS